MSGDTDADRESDADPPREDSAASVESGASAPSDAEGPNGAGAAPEDDAPLSGLAGRIADRRGQDTADTDRDAPVEELDPDLSGSPPPEHDDDPFEEMSVGEIDEETLWSSLESGEATGVGDTAGVEIDSLSGADPAPGVESVEDAGPEIREHVVPKKTYCQSCPYLDDPPALACTHEGTDIVEVVDSERFRVRNCPMVDE
jgi:hypothetical protein